MRRSHLEQREVFLTLLILVTWNGSCRAFVPGHGSYRDCQRFSSLHRPCEWPVRLRQQASSSRLLSQPLVPQENPAAEQLQDTESRSGVKYSSVLDGIHALFPPEDLEKRNAASRTDGYWPYVQEGKDPPKQYTYGEFDFYFFAELLDRVLALVVDDNRDKDVSDLVFCDIGSGTGRLVFSAAVLHPAWKQCRGVELLSSIVRVAQENLDTCRTSTGFALPSVNKETSSSEPETRLPMAPVEFTCGSFEDPYVYFGDANIVFCFSSCMSPELLQGLAQSIGRQCRPGTIVITTDYLLPLSGMIEPTESDPQVPSGPFQLSLVEKVDGWCWLTGGASTAFIHRVEQSLWKDGESELKRPEISLEEQCFRVVAALEEDRTDRYEKFRVGVYNNLMFHDTPGPW